MRPVDPSWLAIVAVILGSLGVAEGATSGAVSRAIGATMAHVGYHAILRPAWAIIRLLLRRR